MNIQINLGDFEEGLKVTIEEVFKEVCDSSLNNEFKEIVNKVLSHYKEKNELNKSIEKYIENYLVSYLKNKEEEINEKAELFYNKAVQKIDDIFNNFYKDNDIEYIIDKKVNMRVNSILNKNKKQVKISEEELLELKKAQLRLEKLEVGGVNNWQWYGESLEGIDKEEQGLILDLSEYEHLED